MKNQQEEVHFNQARASLQQAISWYASVRRHWNYPPQPELQAAVKADLQQLKSALDKLEQKVLKIAVFGLVSRGKSAVINALLGQQVLATGPLHGITQWPRAVRWTPASGKLQVELIDTPGLDEIAGESRAKMAREVVKEADLILFVVAGDITRTEYEALRELHESQKPLILVFNKIDLYPDRDKEAIETQLQELALNYPLESPNLQLQTQVVLVAAEPQPLQVRVEYPDGRIQQEWETPTPQIEQLREAILTILNREGRSLLALNALLQGREAQGNIARKTIEFRQQEAETIIWNYAKYKALAIAFNPIGILDLVAGIVADLALIRALARLYGLPMTSYQAGKLWRKIVASSGSLLITEIVTSVVLGLGKSIAAIASMWESPTAFTLYSSTALGQAAIAGYGAYIVGKIAQVYLEQGCTWGSLGSSTVIEEILAQIESETICEQLYREIEDLK